MAVPSTNDIQEEIRQQQLVGMAPSSQQQTFSPMSPAGNYVPYVPQIPYPVPGAANNANARGTPVNVGKISLLGISFSLMLLGAFTFLGGFFLGIWVARPQVTQPMEYIAPAQNVAYPPQNVPYPQQQGTPFREELGREMGYATRATITSAPIHGEPVILSPLIRAAQEEVGKHVGHRTEEFLREGVKILPSYAPAQVSPGPSAPVNPYSAQSVQPIQPAQPMQPMQPPQPVQLPVITPQSGGFSSPTSIPMQPASQANDGGYTIQLGEYASVENANALVNHMQSLNYPSQITEGKAPNGGKIYYVHSGFYKDYTTALNAVSQFTSQNIPGAIIVKVSQQNKSVP